MTEISPEYLRGKMEALEGELRRHVDDCMVDRIADRAERKHQHDENQKRLRALEDIMTKVRGGWAVLLMLGTIVMAIGGAIGWWLRVGLTR